MTQNDKEPMTETKKPKTDKEEEEEEEQNMNKITSKIFIGDYASSRSIDNLRSKDIKNVISAMKQSFDDHPNFNHLRVPIDDSDKTNICEWFDVVSNWIQSKINDENSGNVLVHCAAGVSRSTTLVAAYLMKAYNLTTEEAIDYITSKRPQVQPTQFFIHQLEMYERCNFEWDPVKYQEQRRFLMGFMASEMKDGVGAEKFYLAYYPSPAPSPKDGNTRDPMSKLTMTPLTVESKLRSPTSLIQPTNPLSTLPPSFPFPYNNKFSNEGSESNVNNQGAGAGGGGGGEEEEVPSRRRFTKRKTPNNNHQRPEQLITNSSNSVKSPPPIVDSNSSTSTPGSKVEKLGKGKVIISGRRLRCKICRRELAARDHLLDHEPGQGQFGFSNQRRDMKVFRQQASRSIKVEKEDESNVNGGDDDDDDDYGEEEKGEEVEKEGAEEDKLMIKKKPVSGLGSLRISLPPTSSNLSNDNITTTTTTTMTIKDEKARDSSEFIKRFSPPLNVNQECSSYFVEPLSWMDGQLSGGRLVGRLICPNLRCGSKLGSFDWAGSQCSCGAWITPGFQILKSKVGEI